MKDSILILCGDKRSTELCRLLETEDRPVRHIPALPNDGKLRSAIEQAKVIVLPTPVSRGTFLAGDNTLTPWKTVFSCFTEKQHVFGGGFSNEQKTALQARTVICTDFLDSERFVRFNAALTAQGALRLVLEQTETYLPQQLVLVAGFGNVGQAVASWLCGVGCRCTVAARNETQRVAAKATGCGAMTLDEAKRTLSQFDVLINTIPAIWLSQKSLSETKPGGIYLELASAPFGAEQEDVERHGMCYIDGKGLPGRFCPQAAAIAMKNCIDAT